MSVLKEMFENLTHKPATTLYPKEKVPVPPAFRGRIAIRDDKCIGCSKCAVVCPTGAIVERDEVDKVWAQVERLVGAETGAKLREILRNQEVETI